MSRPAASTATTPTNLPPARPTWVRWQMVAILVAFSFMTWFNRKSMQVTYDHYFKLHSDMREEVIGMINSAFLWAYLLFMTPGGWLIDRFGARGALIVMGFGSALFGALTGVAGWPVIAGAGLTVACLLAVRSVMGALSAPVYPAAARVVASWMPAPRRAWANGLVQGAAAVGIACALPLFGAMIDWIGWPQAFVVSGAATALVTVAWLLVGANHPSEHRAVNAAERRLIEADGSAAATGDAVVMAVQPSAQRPSAWDLLVANRALMLVTVSYAAVGYMEYLFFFWIDYYFQHILHVEAATTRVASITLYVGFAAGMALGGWLSDRLLRPLGRRWGRALVPMVGMAASAGFLCAALVVTSLPWTVALLALALATVGAAEAPTWTTAIELGGRLGGTAGGICNTGGNAGGSIAPILTPIISHWVMRQFGVGDQAGWQWGIVVASVICLLGAALWLWVRPADPTASRAGADTAVGPEAPGLPG